MYTPKRLLRPASLAFLLMNACGDQASTDYQGEALITIQGRALLVDQTVEGPIVPALAYFAGGEYRVVDADVEGAFPAGFTIRVFDPPPAEAVGPWMAPGPDLALASITAAAPDHPASFPSPSGSRLLPGCELEPVPTPSQGCNEPSPARACPECAPAVQEPCTPISEANTCHRVRRELFCPAGDNLDADPLEVCYAEVRECEFAVDWSNLDENEDYAACELVESSGDPAWGRAFESYFYGMSENHMLLYLASEAAPSSAIARLLDAPSGLTAGYHIVRSRPSTQQELDAAAACNLEAQQEAFQVYQDDHPDSVCKPLLLAQQRTPLVECSGDDAWSETAAAQEVVEQLAAEIADEHRCPFYTETKVEIVDSTQELSIRIGPGDTIESVL